MHTIREKEHNKTKQKNRTQTRFAHVLFLICINKCITIAIFYYTKKCACNSDHIPENSIPSIIYTRHDKLRFSIYTLRVNLNVQRSSNSFSSSGITNIVLQPPT